MEQSGRQTYFAVVLLVAFHAVAPIDALSQSYPTKPIRLVDGFPPGGGTDFLSRNVGQKLMDSWGQPVIVDNRPGVASNLGAEIAAKSTPDGYTLFTACITCLAPAGKLYPHLQYSLVKDLMPVSQVAVGPYVMLVSSSLQANSVKDLIAVAKSKPRKLNYASSGVGSTSHLAAELFKLRTDLNLVHVPFKGGAPAAASLATGEAGLFYGSVPASMPLIKSGRAKAIAVTTPNRVRALPDVPTLAESGLPDLDIVVVYGFLAPRGVPKAIITKLNKEFGKILDEKSVVSRLEAFGLEARSSTPEEFGKLIKEEVSKWSGVAEKAAIRIN